MEINFYYYLLSQILYSPKKSKYYKTTNTRKINKNGLKKSIILFGIKILKKE